MKAFLDPVAIGLMIFNIVMIVGYFSAKWQKKHSQGKEQ